MLESAPQPLDFTARMRAICVDMTQRLDELAHIDMNRVAVCFCQARKRVRHGIFASLTPLRFQGGQTTTVRRGRTMAIQRMLDREGREMLYLLSFYVPRFLDLDLREKLITIVHELWHISPHFNGDIRRHEGRCYAHRAPVGLSGIIVRRSFGPARPNCRNQGPPPASDPASRSLTVARGPVAE